MKKTSRQHNLKALADTVGDFIRYWGFRRIHGQIWTLVYLSEKPLSGAQILSLLGVSKALVSPALVELEKHGLIFCEKLDGRTFIYRANPEVFKVIKQILKTREKVLIKTAYERFNILKNHQESEMLNGEPLSLSAERLESLEEMIVSADLTIGLLLGTPDNELPSFQPS